MYSVLLRCSREGCGAYHLENPRGQATRQGVPCPTCVMLRSPQPGELEYELEIIPGALPRLVEDQQRYHKLLLDVYKPDPASRGLDQGTLAHLACAAYHADEISTAKLAEVVGLDRESALELYARWLQKRENDGNVAPFSPKTCVRKGII